MPNRPNPGSRMPTDHRTPRSLPIPDDPTTEGRGPRDDRPADERDGACGPIAVLHDATFLNAVLPYALGQAKRHREPLSLLCVAVDRLAAIRHLHGAEVADAAVRRVAETVGARLRASDVVARLDDDRIIAVLPDAAAIHAARVAEVLREAIEAAGAASPSMPALTASIGMASYPAHAHDVHSLLAAADEAMVRAERQGRNRVASAAPGSSAPALGVTHCAG
jgi:diguanylate cyclase (GGDEF)-like protein